MPKIDAMFQMMSDKKVNRVILSADKPYQVWVGGQRLERAVTPRAQLRELIGEILPPHLRSALATGQQFGFTHDCPHGRFDVGVNHELGALILTLAPQNAQQLAPRAAPSAPAPAPMAPAPIAPAPIMPIAPSPNAPSPVAHALPHAPPPSPNAPAPIVPAPHYPPPIYPPNAYPPNHYPPQSPVPVQHVHHYHGGPVIGHSPRSRIVAGLLGLLLPALGIHRFYLGYTGAGVCYLLMTFVFSWFTCGITAYLAAFIGFIEGIIILCGGLNDAEGRQLSA